MFHVDARGSRGAHITKLGIVAAMILTATGAVRGGEAWAADIVPTKAQSGTATFNPKPCTGLWDFIATNCELTWQGITIYGTIDVGGGWQSHGAPFDPQSAAGASYRIQRMNRSPLWSLAPHAFIRTTISITHTHPPPRNPSLPSPPRA